MKWRHLQGEPGRLHHCEPRDGSHPVLPPVQWPVLLLPNWWLFTLSCYFILLRGELGERRTTWINFLLSSTVHNNSDVSNSWPDGIFAPGANPGFHEGVADILSLAVGTAEYFQVICAQVTPSSAHLRIKTSFVVFRVAQGASTFLYWSHKFSLKSSQNWLYAIHGPFPTGTISI